MHMTGTANDSQPGCQSVTAGQIVERSSSVKGKANEDTGCSGVNAQQHPLGSQACGANTEQLEIRTTEHVSQLNFVNISVGVPIIILAVCLCSCVPSGLVHLLGKVAAITVTTTPAVACCFQVCCHLELQRTYVNTYGQQALHKHHYLAVRLYGS